MRIGNQSIVRNYTNNLNRNLSQLNKYSTMVQTQRRFSSMAENTSAGVRAMQLRRTMSNIESYTDNASTALSKLGAAEDQLLKVGELGKEITTRYVNALNGTNGPDERKIMANEIMQFRNQILAGANSQFSGRYSFGGTNTTEKPFTVEVTGQDANGVDIEVLKYNGVDVSQMANPDGTLKDEYKYLMKDANFVDIGLGLKEDENGVLIESTAFKNTLTGIDMFGFGEDNIYLVCNELIAALNDPDFTDNDHFQGLLTKMQDATNNVTLKLTEIGAQTTYLKETVDSFETQTINLSERQNAIEFIDPAEAIMQFKMQEYVYNAALQMGQRLLQPTLFNFIN